MKTLLLSADAADTAAVAAGIIKSGGLVAIPTETVYGLGADGLNPRAVAKIFQAKGRPQDNPLILHICGPEQIELFCHDIPPGSLRAGPAVLARSSDHGAACPQLRP